MDAHRNPRGQACPAPIETGTAVSPYAIEYESALRSGSRTEPRNRFDSAERSWSARSAEWDNPDGRVVPVTEGRTTIGASHSKGASFRAFVEWIARAFGDEQLAALYDALSPNLKQLLDPQKPALGILASSWYPDELQNSMLEMLLEPFDPERRAKILADGTRYTVEQTYKGIYRQLIRMFVSPERCAKLVQKAWQMSYDTGAVSWTYIEPDRILSEVRGWRGHHPYRCEISRLSGAYLLEFIGCENVKSIRTACVSKGHDSCRGIITWKVD